MQTWHSSMSNRCTDHYTVSSYKKFSEINSALLENDIFMVDQKNPPLVDNVEKIRWNHKG